MNTMKNNNVIKAMFVAAAMTCLSNVSAIANSNDEEAFVKSKIAPVTNSLSFNVWVEKPNNKKVTVVVVDKDNNEVHREYVDSKSGKFAKTFDFSNLSDGKYTIQVLSSNIDVIDAKTFEIKTNFVTTRDLVVARQK